jgi:lipid-A-disaccharide synthase
MEVTMKQPLIFVSTCEFSGDMHGEVLIREILKVIPEAKFYGIGGSRMASAGMELMLDPTKISTIGFIEALKHLGKMKRLLKDVALEWEKRRPDLVIWLDSGGLNLIIAKAAQERGIPVVCMFSPSAWGYGQDRAVKLAQRVKLLLAVLPFEADFYRKFGANTIHVGHPLIDRVKHEIEPEEYRISLGIEPDRKVVALLPGSRRQEIARLLPVMLEAITDLAKDRNLQIVLPVAASIDRVRLEAILTQYPISCIVTSGGVYNLMAAADAAVIASGTAALEAAIMGTPMVIVYQVSKLSYFIYKRMQSAEHKQSPFIGLPNLVAGKQIVPELTQENFNTANICKHMRNYLDKPEYLAQVKAELRQVKERIGPPGVMPRAAGIIAEMLETRPHSRPLPDEADRRRAFDGER